MNRRELLKAVPAIAAGLAAGGLAKAELAAPASGARSDRFVYNGRGEVVGMLSRDASRLVAKRQVPDGKAVYRVRSSTLARAHSG